MFLGMMGLSAALHSLALIGVPGGGFHSQTPARENNLTQTVKIIRVGTGLPKKAPEAPQEKKIVEKAVEPLPDILPAQEIAPGEETQENEAGEDGMNEAMTENRDEEGETEDGGMLRDSGHDALLAYVKDFIDKNLIYPPMARRRNVEGVVGVYFEIEQNGGPVTVRVDHSSGSSLLDNAAVLLVKKLRPPEHTTHMRPVALRVNITYELTE